MTVNVFTDGASRGNPGPAGIGVVIYKNGVQIKRHAQGVGLATNNVAEYMALVAGARMAVHVGATKAYFNLDSLLVVNQIKGVWKINHSRLKSLHSHALKELGKLAHFDIQHVPRAENYEADRLANIGIDHEKI